MVTVLLKYVALQFGSSAVVPVGCYVQAPGHYRRRDARDNSSLRTEYVEIRTVLLGTTVVLVLSPGLPYKPYGMMFDSVK